MEDSSFLDYGSFFQIPKYELASLEEQEQEAPSKDFLHFFTYLKIQEKGVFSQRFKDDKNKQCPNEEKGYPMEINIDNDRFEITPNFNSILFQKKIDYDASSEFEFTWYRDNTISVDDSCDEGLARRIIQKILEYYEEILQDISMMRKKYKEKLLLLNKVQQNK